MSYAVSEIRPSNKRGLAQAEELLAREGIRKDPNLDYLAGAYTSDGTLVAVGGCFSNTLRCLAVDSAYRGEGIMPILVSHLIQYEFNKGHTHLFLYTKLDNADIFTSMSFREIARVKGEFLLMENRKDGFTSFLDELAKTKRPGVSAAVVVNCNPFTLGHRHLIEQASQNCDTLHLFVVSEDASFFPFQDRYKLVAEGTADLPNVVMHQTGSYMISSAVFPSYFLKDEDEAIRAQAKLDIEIFTKIAKTLDISKRFVGEEPFSQVTGIYNSIMAAALPDAGIECIVVPRIASDGLKISASNVRKLLSEGRIEETKSLVPPTTYNFFSTERGEAVIKTLQQADEVIHY